MRANTNAITIRNPLQPVVLRAIREAFNDAVSEAEQRRDGIALPEDMQSRVARHIVDLARQGERDRARLRDAALSALPH